MPPRSPLDYDVSVSADKRRRAKKRGHTGAFEHSQRTCDVDGCDKPGLYRAPVSPDNLDEFHWFCLEHVRDYNRHWDYFSNRSEEELEDYLRHASVWDRPTWKMGGAGKPQVSANGHAEGRSWQRLGYRDPFEVLGENATLNPGSKPEKVGKAPPRRRMLPPNERRALDILGLQEGVERAEIRARYKALVKDLHPDMNGGARDAEDRLNHVIWAWDQIKGSRNFPA